MKTLITTLSLMLLAMNAMADNYNSNKAGKVYVSLKGDYSIDQKSNYEAEVMGLKLDADINYDNSFGLGAALGYNITENLRGEVEFMFRRHELDSVEFAGLNLAASGHGNTYTTSLNGYYDFVNGSQLTPYVGAGMGATSVEDGDKAYFSYQLMTGVNFDINDSNQISLGYRYFNVPEIKEVYSVGGIQVKETMDIQDHSVEVGYTHSF